MIQVDVRNKESVQLAAETLKSKLGSLKLYALVNNAGVGLNTGISKEDII